MKYLINVNGTEKEVSKSEYIKMEESCGFYSKFDGETACTDFGFLKGGIEIKGKVLSENI